MVRKIPLEKGIALNILIQILNSGTQIPQKKHSGLENSSLSQTFGHGIVTFTFIFFPVLLEGIYIDTATMYADQYEESLKI